MTRSALATACKRWQAVPRKFRLAAPMANLKWDADDCRDEIAPDSKARRRAYLAALSVLREAGKGAR